MKPTYFGPSDGIIACAKQRAAATLYQTNPRLTVLEQSFRLALIKEQKGSLKTFCTDTQKSLPMAG